MTTYATLACYRITRLFAVAKVGRPSHKTVCRFLYSATRDLGLPDTVLRRGHGISLMLVFFMFPSYDMIPGIVVRINA